MFGHLIARKEQHETPKVLHKLLQMRFARGDWQRPSWQGRFADGPAPPHPGAHDLLVACLLIERQAAGEQTCTSPKKTLAESGRA